MKTKFFIKKIFFFMVLLISFFYFSSILYAQNTAFRPSAHGWPFSNSFPEQGMCGGMCWSALDRYYTERYIPSYLQLPVSGDALYEEIYQRLLSTLIISGANFYVWQVYRPDEGSDTNPYHSIGYLVNTEEWPKIKKELDANRPVTLGLVRYRDIIPTNIGDNHQVLAYRYEYNTSTKVVKIWVYDPNHPMDNNVYIQITLGQTNSRLSARQNTGEPLRGFFVIPYDRQSSDRRMRNMLFNHVIFDKIILLSNQRRLHQYLVSFAWEGNVFVDYSIKDFSYQLNEESVCEIPDSTDKYLNKRCPDVVGSRNLPIRLNRTDGTRHTVNVYMFDRLLGSEEVELKAPYIYTLPFLHAAPTSSILTPETDPEGGIQDANINDVVVVKETVTDQEFHNFSNRMIEVRGGAPISYGCDGPGQPSCHLVGFRYNYKLGYIKSQLLGSIRKDYLAENHTVFHRTKKNGIVISSGNIPPAEQNRFSIYQGFDNDDYNANKRIELTVQAMESGVEKARSVDIFYAKSLLCILSPVYSALNPDWEHISLQINEYIHIPILTEFIEELSPAVRQMFNERLRAAEKEKFIKSAENAWEKVKSDPDVTKGVETIYHQSFIKVSNILSNMRYKDIIQNKISRVNKEANDQAIIQSVAFLKSCIVKRLVKDGVYSKLLSDTLPNIKFRGQ